MITPKRDEYEAWEGGLRHRPTGIRIQLDYQNERGEWTFGILKGEPGPYIDRAVAELGADILLDDKYEFGKLSKLRSELLRIESGNVRIEEAHGDGRMVDVSKKRAEKLRSEIAQLEKKLPN